MGERNHRPRCHGVYRTVLDSGRVVWRARVRINATGRMLSLGSYRNTTQAREAVQAALRDPERRYGALTPQDRAERDTRAAFRVIEKYPQAWHMRGMTPDQIRQHVASIPVHVRRLILRYVPHEDDPIFAAAASAGDGLDLLTMGELYGISSERARQLGEMAAREYARAAREMGEDIAP